MEQDKYLKTTHNCCDKRLAEEGEKAHCCYCEPHNNCKFKKSISKLKKQIETPDITLEVTGVGIAMLRQWLNERDNSKLVTNEDIIEFLQIK